MCVGCASVLRELLNLVSVSVTIQMNAMEKYCNVSGDFFPQYFPKLNVKFSGVVFNSELCSH